MGNSTFAIPNLGGHVYEFCGTLNHKPTPGRFAPAQLAVNDAMLLTVGAYAESTEAVPFYPDQISTYQDVLHKLSKLLNIRTFL